jgi:hypothetical protein
MKLSTFLALVSLFAILISFWLWSLGNHTSPVMLGAIGLMTMVCAGVMESWEEG